MRRLAAALLVLATGCSAAGPASTGAPSPTPSAPSAAPSPSPAPQPSFSASRARAHIEALVALGPREAAGEAFHEAADLVGGIFADLGYRVRRQRFEVPHGTVDGDAVPEGESQNVVAEPPGFDPSAPHVVVGGHLDTVPDSPGANDNASGIGVILELARLAALTRPPVPVVFAVLGAEERRRQRPTESFFSLGAKAYIEDMSRPRARALSGMLNLDMVGNGGAVIVVGPDGRLSRAAVRAARRLGIGTVRRERISGGFSDHDEFRAAGYDVTWLWAGEHSSLHRPSDTLSVIETAMLRRIGRVAWALLGSLR